MRKEFKGTKGEWTINHWTKGECGVTCKDKANGITHYTGDNVYREEYRIVSNLHPNSHKIEHSFEGAHIAEISARSEESLANAHLIAAAPDLLEALKHCVEALKVVSSFGATKPIIERAEKTINKALGL